MPSDTDPQYTPMSDAVAEFVKQLDQQTPDDFFSTGYHSHDHALGKVRRCSLILVGARPSMGKTALMLSMAAAAKEKAPADHQPEFARFNSLSMIRRSTKEPISAMEIFPAA